MKKIFCLIMFIGIIAMLTSCSGRATKTSDIHDSVINNDTKVLVAYFSATGTTAKEAKKIADATGGALYEITPIQPYSDADLDYENEKSRTSIEKGDSTIRPEIKTGLDITPYDTIYLGFPVWWYNAPRLIYTFLDTYDFKGKKIVVFATAESSSLKSSFDSLHKAYPQYDLVEGEIYNVSNKPEFKKWVESLKE